MCISTHRQKSEDCLWLLLRLSVYSIETGSLPKPGPHISASLKVCKPSYAPVSVLRGAGVQVLVGYPAYYVSAGVQMLVFRTLEQALRTAEPLTPKCQLLTRPTPLSHVSQIKNSAVGQAAVALTEDKHFDLVLQISLLRMLAGIYGMSRFSYQEPDSQFYQSDL